MKVLGVCCSPRKRGNTEVMLQEALAVARGAGADVEFLTIAGKDIKHCDACETCRKTDRCHIEDDMQDIYPKLLEADGIIFGTPVYFWSVSAQAKTIIDRTAVFAHKNTLRGKVAGVVVTTARAGATSAFTVFNNFFNLQRMIMAGGAIGFSPVASPHGLDEGFLRGGVSNDMLGMDEARALGKIVVRHIKAKGQR